MIDALQHVRWRRPEWTVAALALSAWIVLFGSTVHGGSGAHHHHDPTSVALSAPSASAWIVMVIAMMAPSSLPAVRSLAFASFARRRQRSIALFIGSYVLVWFAFGLGATAVAESLAAGRFGRGPILGAVLLVAAAWEFSPQKRRALRACHVLLPPPPRGLRADLGCARAGLRHGWNCMIACWALMLAMVAGGHASILLTLALGVLVTAQKVIVRAPAQPIPACALILTVLLATTVA